MKIFLYNDDHKKIKLPEPTPEVAELATLLHEKLCRYEHTESCGWYYEFDGRKDRWNEAAHFEYRVKAEKLFKIEPDLEKLKLIINEL